MWGATMFDQLVCRVIFHQLRYEGIFTPPSEQGTLVFPGNLGMFEWGGISVDPNRGGDCQPNGTAVCFETDPPRGPGNPMEQPKDAKGSGTESGVQPQYGVPYGVTLNPFLSFGLPAVQTASMGLYLRAGSENQRSGMEKTYRYSAGQPAVPDAG